MVYRLFKKTVTNKTGKQSKKWYYWYYDPTGKQIKKACRGCNTKSEAEAYIEALPAPCFHSAKIADIARYMYIPGSAHCTRREQFGKSVNPRTLKESRNYVDLIIKIFGNENITDLSVIKIQTYLIKQKKSGSWKNRFLQIFEEIYTEAAWNGHKVSKPVFMKFKRNSKRQSILSTSEIEQFLQRRNFSSDMFYVFFTLSLSAGLRLGEARGFRACQFLEDKQAVIVDGFLLPDGGRQSFCKTGSDENLRHRVVLIPEITKNLLHDWIVKNNFKVNDFIFIHNNKPVRQEYAESEFRRALKKSGIIVTGRKITPHGLRYTYVTRTRRLVDTSATMLMAGHKSEAMTNLYTRFELEETVKKLEPLKRKVDTFFE